MELNRIISKLLIGLGIFLCSQNFYSQTTNIAIIDSTNIAVLDSTNIAVIDSTAMEQKRLKFGVGFGLNFVGGTNISLSPNLMYSLSDKVAIGAGIQGSYAAIKDLQNTTTFGGNVVTQFNPSKKILLLLEYVGLNVTTKTETPTEQSKDTYWDSALFIGAGINITDKIAVGAKYNILYKEDESVYTSPILPFVNISF
ncbi:outer membrane beta-barrel protein [uncultured Muriicola sp.]|uniref:outer membrane beta-barrel protein n=1 Tax=uncultured Muriicola sp. TaxID=1583102 RepID=UPI002622E348|nr:outer membrane beta-barrel protein [uncultured Muriicola sp.]